MPNGLAVGGVSFPLLAPDGSAGAPSYSFLSDSDCGMYLYTVNQVAIAAQGAGYLRVGQGFVEVSGRLDFAATIANPLVTLVPDAANVLAQRNSTNAQTFRVYNTYTDASNYERAMVMWDTNTLKIGMEYAGTGLNRSVHLISGGSLTFFTNSTARWYFDASGHFLANADNTYDIGAVGATRPRIGYFGTSIIIGSLTSIGFNGIFDGGFCRVADAGFFGFSSGDAFISRAGAASVRIGAVGGSATPIAQTLTIGEASRPGTDSNVAGANGTIRSGLGTGNATPSSLIFQIPVAVGAGSTVQTYTDVLTLAYSAVTVNGTQLTFGNSGAGRSYFNTAIGLVVGSDLQLQWSNNTDGGAGSSDVSLARLAAASLRLGLGPSATPVAQTFTVGEFSRVGTDNNVAGSDGTIRSGSGTGNAAGSSLFFDTPTVGASGTVQQSYGHRLTLSALGATFDIPNQGLRINGQTSAAGASTGTLTNAPSVGNPTFWMPINIAGVIAAFPCW